VWTAGYWSRRALIGAEASVPTEDPSNEEVVSRTTVVHPEYPHVDPEAAPRTPADALALAMVDDLLIDPLYHEVLRADRRIELTRLEFRLLHLLARHVNEVVPYPTLIKYGWGYPEVSDPTELLKSPISRLRSKVNLRSPGRLTIRSVARQGYILCANFQG